MKQLIKQYTENYLNKIEIGYRLPPEINLEEFWGAILKHRKTSARIIPLKDQKGENFWHAMPNSLFKKLHDIDSYGRDTLYSAVKKDIESDLIKESLIEEAFYSSVIEGAFSTLKRARELAAEKVSPKDNSERMILNNFYAMRFIMENADRPLSNELVLDLHKIVTENTLEDENFAGKYRNDWVYVTDSHGKTIYTPPPADKVPEAMQALIDWINVEEEAEFIHPAIKAAILHFYAAYVHPFFDGNGRTARALFYFYLIKNGYDFFKYFSISSIISSTRGKYYKCIKDVEDYGSDLTYFLVYMSDSILQAISEIKTKILAHYRKDHFLARIRDEKIALNLRQEKFIKKFLLRKDKQIDVARYKDIYDVVYETARSDLMDLAEKKILIRSKIGKKLVFSLNPDF